MVWTHVIAFVVKYFPRQKRRLFMVGYTPIFYPVFWRISYALLNNSLCLRVSLYTTSLYDAALLWHTLYLPKSYQKFRKQKKLNGRLQKN
jgi:hypothetical protein